MDLIQQVKGYSDSREEEEEEDEEAAIAVAAATEDMMIPIPIPREESSSSRLQQQQDEDSSNNLMMMNQRKQKQQQQEQLELMDLSLGRSNNNNNNNNKNDEANFNQQGVVIGGGCGSSTTTTSTNNNNEGNSSSTTNTTSVVEKEHMFDKVVTPSDVGKLNRLVIPKQHAEKYFPLDSSSNEKGLLLNFEDRNGKLWRFRYSYWNSSQSYVMTKGWSRFVKEKKLDSGDIVSFQRGVGEMYRHRLYIDWRRRPDHLHAHAHAHAHNPLHHHHHHDPNSPSTLFSPLFLPNQYSITWGGRLYSLPSPSSSSSSTSSTMLQHNHNYGSHVYNNAFHHQQQQQQQQLQLNHHHRYYDGRGGSGLNYLRSTPSMSMHQIGDQNFQERGNISSMIIDSVPVTHHHHQQQHQQHHGGIGTNTTTTPPSSSNVGKRLRLFGVNMECGSSSSMEDFNSNSICLSTSTSAPLHVSMPNSSSLPSSSLRLLPYEEDEDSSPTKGTTSVLFDLDPSLQYRQ